MLLTTVALGYVHQQIELLRINYSINRNKDNLTVLLDQNSTLMYNVSHLQSYFNFEQALIREEGGWEIPASWYTIGLAEAAR